MIIVKKPKIRFKGFTETWEQRKLGNVFKEYSEKNHGELPALTIVQGQGTIYRNESERNLMYEKSNLSSYKMVRKNDFIVHLRSFEGGLEIATLDGIISPAYHTLHGDNTDSRFYYSYFRSYEFINHGLVPHVYGIRDGRSIDIAGMKTILIPYTSFDEQKKIGNYIETIDHLITLHQRKCENLKKLKKFMLQKLFPQNGENVPKVRFLNFTDTWEQRKLCEVFEERTERAKGNEELLSVTINNGVIRQIDSDKRNIASEDKSNYKIVQVGDVPYNSMRMWQGAVGNSEYNGIVIPAYTVLVPSTNADSKFFVELFKKNSTLNIFQRWSQGLTSDTWNLKYPILSKIEFYMPMIYEQKKIGSYFSKLDHLITLHQHKLNILKDIKKYMIFGMLNIEGGKNMPELELIIEKNLIDQLVLGDSQWTYRPDLKSEKDLWDNFRYILEQNNKDRLNGQPLSDNEFEQVKNQLQFSSFYKAGEWLVGKNGKVMVHVQRDTEKLHLVVMNHEHIAGGSSVYEVINQYSTLQSDKENGKDNNSRFDVTLMINGLPMIHIELKNKSHPYMEAFNQIKRYIGEGKFTGIFSAVQMFVVSNGVDTKYFSAASDTELNPKFMSGWFDEKNNPVTDYIDFAKSVLSIPQAHEMIARYTVLDEDSKKTYSSSSISNSCY